MSIGPGDKSFSWPKKQAEKEFHPVLHLTVPAV